MVTRIEMTVISWFNAWLRKLFQCSWKPLITRSQSLFWSNRRRRNKGMLVSVWDTFHIICHGDIEDTCWMQYFVKEHYKSVAHVNWQYFIVEPDCCLHLLKQSFNRIISHHSLSCMFFPSLFLLKHQSVAESINDSCMYSNWMVLWRKASKLWWWWLIPFFFSVIIIIEYYVRSMAKTNVLWLIIYFHVQ